MKATEDIYREYGGRTNLARTANDIRAVRRDFDKQYVRLERAMFELREVCIAVVEQQYGGNETSKVDRMFDEKWGAVTEYLYDLDDFANRIQQDAS